MELWHLIVSNIREILYFFYKISSFTWIKLKQSRQNDNAKMFKSLILRLKYTSFYLKEGYSLEIPLA